MVHMVFVTDHPPKMFYTACVGSNQSQTTSRHKKYDIWHFEWSDSNNYQNYQNLLLNLVLDWTICSRIHLCYFDHWLVTIDQSWNIQDRQTATTPEFPSLSDMQSCKFWYICWFCLQTLSLCWPGAYHVFSMLICCSAGDGFSMLT